MVSAIFEVDSDVLNYVINYFYNYVNVGRILKAPPANPWTYIYR